jgi:hypothetical protein
MYEDDHGPVTLSETYHLAASCQRTVDLARERSCVFEQFLPLENYRDILSTGCASSHHVAMWDSVARTGSPKDSTRQPRSQ